MKVLFLTDGPTSPGSRYRCLQYFPHLERMGVTCEVRFSYDSRYNRLVRTAWSIPYRLAGRIRRSAHTVLSRGYDLLYIHKTALAFSGLPERLRSNRNCPMVFDFDDALDRTSTGEISILRRRAFRQVVASVDHIVPGNRYLAEHAGAPEKTTIIPTVVDTDTYTPAQAFLPQNRFTVGWMGTSVNFPNVAPVIPSLLRALSQIPGGRLRLVSNATLPAYSDHPLVDQVPWSSESELTELRSFDVGIMPLQDNPSTLGKCGFKLLQYMSVGKPTLASAVGANIEILRDQGAGYLLSQSENWGDALLRMAADRASMAHMGERGRSRVVSAYSIKSSLPTLLNVIMKAAGSRRSASDTSHFRHS